MNHIEANNIVTIKSLKTNRTPDVIGSVIDRLEYVYDMSKEYLNNNMMILDMGTKDCLFFDNLVKHGFIKNNLIGIDCCMEVIDICTNKGYNVVNGDIQNVVFDDNEFDFIFIVHTLEHVPNPQLVVEECKRILKPNGYVFVEVPIQFQIDTPEKWGHYHPFTSKNQIKDLFSDFIILKEDQQKTKSKSPWYRIIFQMV